MMPSKVNDILDNWSIDITRSFKHKCYSLYGPEYLVIRRVEPELFQVDKDRSTIDLGKITKKELTQMLSCDILEPIDTYTTYSYKGTKGNGCSCGSWIMGESYPHSDGCIKYKGK